MRLLVITLVIFIAVPPAFCAAICAAAPVEVAHAPLPPCHEDTPDSPASESNDCTYCDNSAALVPGTLHVDFASILLVVYLQSSIEFESAVAIRTSAPAYRPPDWRMSPYVRNNPPLLN
jgi:hypothetical protein